MVHLYNRILRQSLQFCCYKYSAEQKTAILGSIVLKHNIYSMIYCVMVLCGLHLLKHFKYFPNDFTTNINYSRVRKQKQREG